MKAAHSLVVGDGGSTTEFACTCGVRGTYERVLRHVTASTPAELTPSLRSQGFLQRIVGEITQCAPDDDYASVTVSSVPVDNDDFGGGNTKAHYLPNEPKRPALPALPEVVEPISHDVAWGATPSYIEPEQTSAPVQPSHHVEQTAVAQPEGHSRSNDNAADPAPVPTRSIAEAFQDMLRVAYQAGAASAATGETFETWYQWEVLR